MNKRKDGREEKKREEQIYWLHNNYLKKIEIVVDGVDSYDCVWKGMGGKRQKKKT